MPAKTPILLSFYALSNGNAVFAFGQLTYSRLHDVSFRDFSRRKTFRTLIALYRTQLYALQNITLVFNNVTVSTRTDAAGSFSIIFTADTPPDTLQKILLHDGVEVVPVQGLYTLAVHHITSRVVIVSDMDDTL